MIRKRAEFSLRTKLEAMVRYLRCPGLPEKGITCGRKFGTLSEVEFDHIAREEATQDNSVENCRPLCKECHRIKTSGTKATSAGSDVHMAAKAKRIRKKEAGIEPKFKRKIPSRPSQRKERP